MTGGKYFKSLLLLGGVVSVFAFGKTALADDAGIQPIEQSEGFNLMTEGYALGHVLKAVEGHGAVYRVDRILQMKNWMCLLTGKTESGCLERNGVSEMEMMDE